MLIAADIHRSDDAWIWGVYFSDRDPVFGRTRTFNQAQTAIWLAAEQVAPPEERDPLTRDRADRVWEPT